MSEQKQTKWKTYSNSRFVFFIVGVGLSDKSVCDESSLEYAKVVLKSSADTVANKDFCFLLIILKTLTPSGFEIQPPSEKTNTFSIIADTVYEPTHR